MCVHVRCAYVCACEVCLCVYTCNVYICIYMCASVRWLLYVSCPYLLTNTCTTTPHTPHPHTTPTQGTDLSMLQKLHNQHGTNPHYVMPKSSIVHEFGIVHFAGTVSYQAKGFLDKNRDTFSNDLFDLLSRSRSPFLLEIFKSDRSMVSIQASHTYM